MSNQRNYYQARERLKDNREVLIAAVNPAAKLEFQEVRHLSSHTSAFSRFFTELDQFSSQELPAAGELNFETHAALVARVITDGREQPAGVARYIVFGDRGRDHQAEVAFTVLEEFQGLGVGSALLKHLSIIGRTAGIKRFFGYVLPENIKMIRVFESCRLPLSRSLNEVGVLELIIELG